MVKKTELQLQADFIKLIAEKHQWELVDWNRLGRYKRTVEVHLPHPDPKHDGQRVWVRSSFPREMLENLEDETNRAIVFGVFTRVAQMVAIPPSSRRS